jgi:hypothetical protein
MFEYLLSSCKQVVSIQQIPPFSACASHNELQSDWDGGHHQTTCFKDDTTPTIISHIAVIAYH